MERTGKAIVIAGLCIVLAGIVVWLAGDKLRFLGRLPGDIRYETANAKVYIPITTMILLSILLSLVMWVIQKFR
jgi:hypothetical protein